MSGTRRVFIKSFGCQMNVYDSHRMADMLAPEGYAETPTPDNADLVILNTCHIREKAAEKVYSEIGRIRRIKQAAAGKGRRITLAVAGCVAQAEGKEIVRRAPAVDLVVGPQNYHRLPGLLARAESGKPAQMQIEQPPRQSPAALAGGDGDGEDFRLAGDNPRQDETSQTAPDEPPVGHDILAVDEQVLDLLLAPSAMEGRRVQRGDRSGIARRGFRKRGLAAREQSA